VAHFKGHFHGVHPRDKKRPVATEYVSVSVVFQGNWGNNNVFQGPLTK